MKSTLRTIITFLIGCIFATVLLAVCSKSEKETDPLVKISASMAQGEAEHQNRAGANDSITASRHNAITKAVAKVSPAVVGINVTAVREYYRTSPFTNDPFFRHFFPNYRIMREVESLGSGFIFSREGHILTNYHVVENAVEIIVTMAGGDQFEAELIGDDSKTDIAVLKIKSDKEFSHIQFGNSDNVLIGEWAIALGNPFGLFDVSAKPTVTVGVISAIGQDFGRQSSGRVYEDMIQTDAAINSGNSGGPLVNSLGNVIGMNTFIVPATGSTGNIGIGFAIPINRVKHHLNDLLEYGKVKRNFWTGIQYDELTPMVARYLGLESTNGVIITDIEPNSPAEDAGLQYGDVIVKINGQKVINGKDVKEIIESEDLKQDDTLELVISRKAELYEAKVTLEAYPKDRKR